MRGKVAAGSHGRPGLIITAMDQPDLIAMGQKAGTPFGAVFAKYSKAFRLPVRRWPLGSAQWRGAF